LAASACGDGEGPDVHPIVEAALQGAIERAQARDGFVLVADAVSGRVLARAGSVPDQIDGASMLKPLLAETALARGMARPDEVLECGPSERLTVAQMIAMSSNACAAVLAHRLGLDEDWAGCVRPQELVSAYARIATGPDTPVRGALRAAVLEGTGKRAASTKVTTAGKTGTSLGTAPRCPTGRPTSSFIGYAPVEAPRWVVLTAIIEPNAETPLGARFAAPLFRDVVEAALAQPAP
jgi:cell division protein FtsI/penicillin-binding protein 2